MEFYIIKFPLDSPHPPPSRTQSPITHSTSNHQSPTKMMSLNLFNIIYRPVVVDGRPGAQEVHWFCSVFCQMRFRISVFEIFDFLDFTGKKGKTLKLNSLNFFVEFYKRVTHKNKIPRISFRNEPKKFLCNSSRNECRILQRIS